MDVVSLYFFKWNCGKDLYVNDWVSSTVSQTLKNFKHIHYNNSMVRKNVYFFQTLYIHNIYILTEVAGLSKIYKGGRADLFFSKV